ncbi:MAG: ribosome biogenesis GTP-binding protein YihA/YsxC [Magnetococcus sp. DMHC-6]
MNTTFSYHRASPPPFNPTAEFMAGAVSLKSFPPESLPEIAFAGRSNVGKSSLLNRVLNKKKLVRVSRTPGCTKQVNFFLIQKQWLFVDLPGYGYAQVNRDQRSAWDHVMAEYLSSRRNLRAVLVLFDGRRGVMDTDRQMIDFLAERGLPFLPIATKIDKMNASERDKSLKEMTQQFVTVGKFVLLPIVATSAHNGDGMEELWRRLRLLLDPEEAFVPPQNLI